MYYLQVQEYLDNLGTEYRFSCYYENEPKGCHLLADYMEAIKKDSDTAFKVYLKNCDERNHAHSCHKVAGYRDGGSEFKVDFLIAFFFGCHSVRL